MARVPEEVIRSVQEAVDVVDVVSRYVTLKRSGRTFMGLCPFHEEKTPSFAVFPESGRFKCFGCGEGGDVFTFLMKRANLGFREVLEELARETGVALPREEDDPRAEERAGRRRAALDALEFAVGFFRAVLAREAGRAARAYLAERGFDEATLETFRVGFAPDEFEGLLGYARSKGLPERALVDAGLVRRNERGHLFDMFRGRITFPIHDLRGRVIGFGARALGDAQPKYLNSPDGVLFHKGREMYGLHVARDAARERGRLLVVEGYTDVMQCHQAGLREVAAGLGTALTPDNARQMRRFGVPVFLVYDGDEAGRRAAERAAEVFLAESVEGGVALLPAGRDPADVVRAEGPGPLEAAVAGARDLWSYLMERVRARHPGGGLEARERTAKELVAVIGRIAEPVRRDVAFRLLSEEIGVPESTLRNQIRGPRAEASREEAPASGWVRAEADLLAASLAEPALWERVAGIYPPGRFRDPGLRAVAEAAGDLRGRGESLTREALLGVLADRDEAIRALAGLEPAEEAVRRAERHLERLAEQQRLEAAVATRNLEAVIRARRDSVAPADG